MESIKEQAVEAALDALAARHRRAVGAAGDAHAYATDEDSAAESKYDTRTIEASYLAAGQAEQAEALAQALESFQKCQFPAYTEDDQVAPGALVEVELEGEIHYYLLAQVGGGTTCKFMGVELAVLSPDAPLYKKLLGLRCGEQLEDPELTVFEVS